jgi:CRP-like cAMP-binding protein/HEAT repeat protein
VTAFLGKLFNVRPAEWPRVQVLFAMVAVLLIGSMWGESIVEAAFLRQVGVRYLPLAIMANAIFSILAMAFYTAFADRVANDRLLLVILGAGVVGILVGLALLAGGLVVVAFPLLYMVAAVPLTDVFNVHWATYVNGFYDTRAARRIVPVLGAGARLAGIVAGLTMPIMNTALPPTGIIAIWLACVAGMAMLGWQMPRLLKEPPTLARATRSPVKPPSMVAHLREGYRYVSKSPFLRVMALTALLTMVLLAFINYQAGKVLLERLGTVQNIANFTGLLNGLGNLVALPFQLIFLSRVIGRVGLGNMSLVFPLTTVAACGGLVAAPGLASAAFGQLDRSILRTTFRNPIDTLLYNAVPLRMKGRARGFIAGLMVPAGSLIGGCLLLLLQADPAWAHATALVLVGLLAATLLVAAWMLRREYSRALIALLEQEDYSSFLAQDGQDLAAADPATLQQLRDRLTRPDAQPDMVIFMAELISQVGGDAAGPILAQACRSIKDGRVRSAILDILSATGLQNELIRQLSLDSLADADRRVRQSAIAALENLAGAGDEGVRTALVGMTGDPDFEVRVRALLALAAGKYFDRTPVATSALRTLLADPDARARSQGVRVLAQLDSAGAYSRLLPFLVDPADDVRLEAALALEARSGVLPGSGRDQQVGLAGALVSDPVERVRLVALALLRGSNSPAAYALLVTALADASPRVRDTATRALLAAGAPAIPWLRPLLESNTHRLRNIAVGALCRINLQEFAGEYGNPTISAELQHISADRTRWEVLAHRDGCRSLALLRSALAERDQQWLGGVFDLLGSIYGDEPMRLVLSSLRSPESRVRSNAVEALEALTSPALALMVAQLFEPAVSGLALADQTTTPNGFEAALRELADDPSDPLVQSIAVFVMDELGDARDPTLTAPQGGNVLSTIERILFLKEVSFFQGMTIEQLRTLATVCDEEFFAAEQRIFNEGDPGGTMYCVVSGRVGLEQEKRKGSVARLATLEARAYFGEMNLFDDSPRSVTALAIQDTLTLRLRREPLIALARQYPDLSLELIKVLSGRLRELNDRMAEMTRTRPRELHKLYDQLDIT